MFKIFKNKFYFYIFIAFILFFAQTAESHINLDKDLFQSKIFFNHQKENIFNKNIDMNLIYTTIETNKITFMKVKQESFFSLFWGMLSFFMTIFVFGFR
ncbi:hypothetical protein [Bartonella tribocorum]|uniref:hypothetical protein n=1 Tax=Bartonella tribocorum TaxID=85701 RepID=UPI00043B1BC4|nr:hypothetical protein [Bartonella tribocorum]CDO49327.1 hypothetical protein BM1374166_01672 [Bartonella tribocorum]